MYNILMHSDEVSRVEYDPNHPFKPGRGKQLLDLLKRHNLIYEDNQKVISPQPLDESLLLLAHTRYYIDLFKRADEGEFSLEMLEAGLGTGDNPIFRGMYRFALITSGGTWQGAQMLDAGEARFVFNPIGGYHHAGKNHAGGFCYVNDIGIAIMDLIKKGRRVVYIDIDVHHGNGVQDLFYKDDRVLKISIHESGMTLYPWSGFQNEIGADAGRGYNVNIPLLKGTDDEVYVEAFESVVPPLVKAFGPDIVFAQIGGDVHKEDPLAHLRLTSNGYKRVIQIINELSPKIMATGGGGYNVYKTSALWALAWATFCGITPSDHYAGVVGGMMYGPEAHAGSLEDEPFVAKGAEKDEYRRHAAEVVDYIRKQVFPIHGMGRA